MNNRCEICRTKKKNSNNNKKKNTTHTLHLNGAKLLFQHSLSLKDSYTTTIAYDLQIMCRIHCSEIEIIGHILRLILHHFVI